MKVAHVKYDDCVLIYSDAYRVHVSTFQGYIRGNIFGVHLWDFSWKKLKKKRSVRAEVL